MKYTSTKTKTFENRLSLIVFNDSLYSVLYSGSSSRTLERASLKDVHDLSKSMSSVLEEYYVSNEINFSTIQHISICFVNQSFQLQRNGEVKSEKDQLPSLLYYHEVFFDCSISISHISDNIFRYISSNVFKLQGGNLIWFHLRKDLLFVSISKGRNLLTATCFEVGKTIDVFYFILFNAHSALSTKSELETIFVSGDLLDLAELPEFLAENFPGQTVISPEDIELTRIPIHKSLYPYFPELAIESL